MLQSLVVSLGLTVLSVLVLGIGRFVFLCIAILRLRAV